MPTSLVDQDTVEMNLISKAATFCHKAQKKIQPPTLTLDGDDIDVCKLSNTVSKWASENWDKITGDIIPQDFWSDEHMEEPTKGKGLCPRISNIPSAVIQLVLWSCFSPECGNLINKCLDSATCQNSDLPSKKYISSWLEAYAASVHATVWYSTIIIHKISKEWDPQDELILGCPILCEACFLSLAIERSSHFATAIGTNANALKKTVPRPILVVNQYMKFLVEKKPNPPVWQPLKEMLTQSSPPGEDSWFETFGLDHYFSTTYLEKDQATMRLTTTETSTSTAARQLVHEIMRSEERRVGKECRSRWSPYH